MIRSGHETHVRSVASSISSDDVPDEDLAEYAPLFEALGLDGADILWRRLYLLHPDSRSLEGVRRTDPGVDVGGLLRTVMRREEEASTDWRPLRPRVLAHLVYEGLGDDVARLVRTKEGRYESCILGNSGRADAIALCRELARIGRYREAAVVGRTAIRLLSYNNADRYIVYAADLMRFMDSVPGFEDLQPPHSEFVAHMIRIKPDWSFWEIYGRQREPDRRIGYIW